MGSKRRGGSRVLVGWGSRRGLVSRTRAPSGHRRGPLSLPCPVPPRVAPHKAGYAVGRAGRPLAEVRVFKAREARLQFPLPCPLLPYCPQEIPAPAERKDVSAPRTPRTNERIPRCSYSYRPCRRRARGWFGASRLCVCYAAELGSERTAALKSSCISSKSKKAPFKSKAQGSMP